MKLVDEETGQKYEANTHSSVCLNGIPLYALQEIPLKPKKIDWSKVYFDVVPIKFWDAADDVHVGYVGTVKPENQWYVIGMNRWINASLITGKKFVIHKDNPWPLPDGYQSQVIEAGEYRIFEVIRVAGGWEE